MSTVINNFEKAGFEIISVPQHMSSVFQLQEECSKLLLSIGTQKAGIRNLLGSNSLLTEFCRTGWFFELAQSVLGNSAQPVRVILFDKSPEANWSVPWHQDLSIAVSGEGLPEGYGQRSIKEGVPHIIPPQRILENMVTLRLHLDACPLESGPLVVSPGSHRYGKSKDGQIAPEVLEANSMTCIAELGDVLMMRPLLFHRSSKATSPTSRKILHVEYAGVELDHPLEWWYREAAKP
ncbi:MAG: phytanoyl-CoA dioxygenase family protein [Candidatus Sumerlaeia bacterium]|nr:phytanoyl-CoA dioxygenase family protein [Candidatus Sumerlaeia bacterium]